MTNLNAARTEYRTLQLSSGLSPEAFRKVVDAVTYEITNEGEAGPADVATKLRAAREARDLIKRANVDFDLSARVFLAHSICR